MIDHEVIENSVRRRWLLPAGVATAVTATGVAAALAFGGGTKGPAVAAPGSGGTPAAATSTLKGKPAPDTIAKLHPGALVVAAGAACQTLNADTSHDTQLDPGYVWGGMAGTGTDPFQCLEVPAGQVAATVEPTDPKITPGTQTGLTADQVAKILQSCLGDQAAKTTTLLAEKTAIATANQDSLVIVKNTQGQYATCDGLGDTGRSQIDPKFHDASSLTSGNAYVRQFENGTDSNTPDHATMLIDVAGWAAPSVTQVTVSFGTQTTQYPALLKNGVYFASVSTARDPNWSHPPVAVVHAFDASGKEVYNSVRDAATK